MIVAKIPTGVILPIHEGEVEALAQRRAIARAKMPFGTFLTDRPAQPLPHHKAPCYGPRTRSAGNR